MACLEEFEGNPNPLSTKIVIVLDKIILKLKIPFIYPIRHEKESF